MSLPQVRGATVVVTGTFEGMTRKEVVSALEDLGATVTGAVSGRTTLVIAGAKAGSKLKKALALGVEIVDQDALFALLAARPEPDTSRIIPGIVGSKVVVTGSFTAFERDELGAILIASGATMADEGEVPEDTTDLISGDRWDDEPLRKALELGAQPWTEGQVLEALAGRHRDGCPEPEEVPHGARLDALEAVEFGEAEVETPTAVSGRLTLKWKKVRFAVPLRFGELYGFAFHTPEYSWVGRFHLDGEPLSPEPGGAAECFKVMAFWEDGSDADDFDETLAFEGTCGFNCTGLKPDKRLSLSWSKVQGQRYRARYSVEHPWFGLNASFPEDGDIEIDFEARTWRVEHSVGPHMIDPDEPWERC